ncbi:bifunctional metallophosphatase/5'-nucleotidase [Candidatus Epulonipiscium fishelsonii]|uniref:Bifunctional metallophosphatase/5'-nucleotidase n=1 Tax=Candidatus Epulonipiscium fishelsonii TaxID=77094 RepID=A0ACC8XBA9_9FIRM|nr:bifunctional metallophosphatase/5'-nucleotidase [Epulopiscium sp. SCG-B11WGA-EpuloA1]ONI41296.1 bifunctional metallophosphatase/5'-nucleotidase [Epulopiscium sp. SCG-B05WGA-EpuloA1]
MIKIYYTTDTHGHIFPINYATNKPAPVGVLACGKEFEKDGNTIIIDAGDTIQGSPFTKYMWGHTDKGCIVSEVLNKVGYDFVTLGNHDFNYGYDGLKRYINNLDATCLVANMKDMSREIYNPDCAVIHLKNGTKVGIVGVVTDYVPIWEKPANLKNLKIQDAFLRAQKALDYIRDKCDIKICIYHGGFECDVPTGKVLSNTNENVGYKICKELDFDILLTGHQHMPLEGINLFGTFTMQLRHNATEYGYIEIDGENIKSETRKPKIMDVEIEPHWQVLQDEVDIWLDQTIGTFNKKIEAKNKLTLALEGSTLANFCNQVQKDFSNADFSCTALGNDSIGFNKKVTIRDIVSAYQFPNTLKVIEVTKDILKEALERAAEYYDVMDGKIQISDRFLIPKVEHYNFDFFLGFEYVIDVSKPLGERVVEINQDGKPLEDKVYTLVLSDYRATGAGGYPFYANCKVVKEYSVDVQELIIEYIKEHKNIKVDKRKYFTILQD